MAADLLPHGIEIPLHPIHADRDRIDEVKCFACLAWTGVKSPLNAIFEHPADCNPLICRRCRSILANRVARAQITIRYSMVALTSFDRVKGATPEALIVAFCRLAKLLLRSF